MRIFEKKCVPCHAPGRAAMPLASYHDVLPWTRAIREEILERRMPPWSAAHGVQPLANDNSLSAREIAIVVSWADGGAARGDPADLKAAAPRPRWRRASLRSSSWRRRRRSPRTAGCTSGA